LATARKVAAALIVLLSLWQLIVWGFWGVLGLLLSASSLRQLVVGATLLVLAVLNPITALALLLRGTIVRWLLVLAVFVGDVVASVFFFSAAQRTWADAVAAGVAVVLLAVAFPRRVTS
jgi:hypothetical protein